MVNINVFQLVCGSWEEDLSKFSLFCPLLGPQKGPAPYFNKYESPSPRHVYLLPSLVEIGLVVLEKKIFLSISLCKNLSPWGGAIHDPRDFIW